MKREIAVVLFLLSAIVASGAIIAAQAYYNVTSNIADPENVQPGTNIVITATTDENFASAKFTWKNQAGITKLEETAPFTGTTTKTAVSDFVVNDGGVWTVTVYSNNGRLIGTYEYNVKVGFNVVPEIPLLGTAGASIAMLAGFAYKMKRKH